MSVKQLREYTREAGIARRYQRPIKNRMTPAQLQLFAQNIERYKIGTNLYDINSWLKDNKAISQDGSIIVTNYKRAKYTADFAKASEPTDCDPILFEQLQEDLEQFLSWKCRKEYAGQKQLQDFEEFINK